MLKIQKGIRHCLNQKEFFLLFEGIMNPHAELYIKNLNVNDPGPVM